VSVYMVCAWCVRGVYMVCAWCVCLCIGNDAPCVCVCVCVRACVRVCVLEGGGGGWVVRHRAAGLVRSPLSLCLAPEFPTHPLENIDTVTSV
jgi:hypothetical protein